jgi:hypothetical protein
MKATLITMLMVVWITAVGSDEISPRLESFLRKMDNYYSRHTAKWSMPNNNPSPTEDMPSPNIVGSMVDTETGISFSPSTGNLYHPELEIGLHTATGTVVDFKTGKKYSLSDLLKERKNRSRL